MTDPFPGLTPNLVPNPPGEIPEAQGAGDATARLSPFSEAIDVDDIIANLTLDRPLKLFIPNKHKYPDFEFHIINNIPSEIADAHNKGFREVTDLDLVESFTDLVAGTDKQGKAYRPMLMGRPKVVGEHVRKERRRQLQSLYAGMDPRNKEIGSKYVENIKDGKDASKGSFEGAAWRIRV
jgi:hypothetical protein